MNLEEFINKIKEINDNSWGYGNEILYLMGKDITALNDPQKLAGAIWIIGRSYAASPQRRSYGNTENTNHEYFNITGKATEKRPIWPVKTQNDGREGFFDEIAKKMDVSCLDEFIKNYHKNSLCYYYSPNIELKNNKIEVDLGKDKNLLINAIVSVLSFNRELSKSIEKFDNVPETRVHNGCEIKCNNHISFASKFLHFYFPNLIFIIDGFAYNGGNALFNGSTKKKRYLETPADENNFFEEEIYKNFSKAIVKSIVDDISTEINTKLGTVKCEKDDNIQSGDDDEKIEGGNYIQHCVRSYLLGVFLQSQSIKPQKYIDSEDQFRPMPRLTDMIFLNIKKPLCEKEVKYNDILNSLYYNPSK